MKIYSRYSDKNLTRETHYLMDYLTLRMVNHESLKRFNWLNILIES